MNILEKILKKARTSDILSAEEIVTLLQINDEEYLQKLFSTAYEIKKQIIGKNVSLRGIIELGNYCQKNCYYCGIRSGNTKMHRYMLSEKEILDNAKLAYQFGYGSIVLQGGEIDTPKYIDFIENVLIKIKELSNNELGITLSLGEQTLETYKRWRDAGAHRYLLRIETSSEVLYRKLHPESHSFTKRLEALEFIRQAGFQVGSGIMIGFHGQTLQDMAQDLLFLKELDVDMVGMGPYSIHHDTPMGATHPPMDDQKQLYLGLKMIAILRILMRDINIASTTVLQALAPNGRELGLMAGANVIMPNISNVENRKNYQLYDNKPGIDENANESREALEQSIKNIGENILYNQWGDSVHERKEL